MSKNCKRCSKDVKRHSKDDKRCSPQVMMVKKAVNEMRKSKFGIYIGDPNIIQWLKTDKWSPMDDKYAAEFQTDLDRQAEADFEDVLNGQAELAEEEEDDES